MITPRFSLSQNDIFLFINIRAPYCNLKELEIYVEKNDFRFVCAPYYLRLNLPGNIIDNDNSSGEYKTDDGEFILKYSKETSGEFFDGLEFITSLLNCKKTKNLVANIEVLNKTQQNLEDNEIETEDNDNAGDEWSINQTLPEQDEVKIVACKYGFSNQKYGILGKFEDEFYSVFDVRNVDSASPTDRKLLKTDTEAIDFSSDHYIADYFDDAQIKELIKRSSPWEKLIKNEIKFSDNEKDILKDISNKEYLLDSNEINLVLLSLMDILYAYCYDMRSTEFENNCESGWTITKLSSTLCWFDSFTNENETLISSFRRSLIYPLYRNFELSLQIHKDLIALLNLGPVYIVKCLINIYNIFNTSADPRYILNDLYIKDYIIYMQKCPKKPLEDVIKSISGLQIMETDINLNLCKLLQDQLKETNAGNSILEKMAKLNISRIESDSESSEDSESDSESETSTEESTTDTDSPNSKKI